jgi:hypothetical protein
MLTMKSLRRHTRTLNEEDRDGADRESTCRLRVARRELDGERDGTETLERGGSGEEEDSFEPAFLRSEDPSLDRMLNFPAR